MLLPAAQLAAVAAYTRVLAHLLFQLQHLFVLAGAALPLLLRLLGATEVHRRHHCHIVVIVFVPKNIKLAHALLLVLRKHQDLFLDFLTLLLRLFLFYTVCPA